MAKHFTDSEWQKINQLFAAADEANFGLPTRRDKSVVIGTFNIRSLGEVSNRTPQSWAFLTETCSRFDLLAIQEVKDDLAGLRKIKEALDKESGEKVGLVVSDVTGVNYGRGGGSAERLAFLFRWDRISRKELASDISCTDSVADIASQATRQDVFSEHDPPGPLQSGIQGREDQASGDRQVPDEHQ